MTGSPFHEEFPNSLNGVVDATIKIKFVSPPLVNFSEMVAKTIIPYLCWDVERHDLQLHESRRQPNQRYFIRLT